MNTTDPTTAMNAVVIHVTDATIRDTHTRCIHPQAATVVVNSKHLFVAEDPRDWRHVLDLAGMRGGVVEIPDNGVPGPAWMAAAKTFARMARCLCGNNPLDPEDEASFDRGLCPACLSEAEWENTHSDYAHDADPDPTCPICQAEGLA